MITIADYGLGNVQALVNIYRKLGIPVRTAASKEDLGDSEKIILPGVGAFDWAMHLLDESGMRETLDHLVVKEGCPVLGICVGMQMMATRSDEGGRAGLGWIEADVKLFGQDRSTDRLRLPHMGWNDVNPVEASSLFKDMGPEARFYFLHSYYFEPKDPTCILATTDFHGSFASSVRSANILGAQFHPEKSHQWGVQLLKNFAEL